MNRLTAHVLNRAGSSLWQPQLAQHRVLNISVLYSLKVRANLGLRSHICHRMSTASSEDTFNQFMKDYDTFLFDCDGVLWSGDVPIQGAPELVNHLKQAGKRVVFVTNNSTKSRDKYVTKLKRLGYPSEKENLFGTAYTSAIYLKDIAQVSGKVYVVGNESMAEELDLVGVRHFGVGPDHSCISQSHDEVKKCELDPDVSAVLVGFDGHFSFAKLVKAASYLRDPNCLYVATNDDSRFPLGDSKYVVPGTGCFVTAVSTVSERQPDAWCGKPSTFMFNCILEKMEIDPKRTVMVGDRMNTDILFGKRNRLTTLLVLSGVESESTLNDAKQKALADPTIAEQVPDYFLSSLNDWAQYCDGC